MPNPLHTAIADSYLATAENMFPNMSPSEKATRAILENVFDFYGLIPEGDDFETQVNVIELIILRSKA